MALRRFAFLAGASLLTGCAAESQRAATGRLQVPAPSAFRSPASIRPDDATINPRPVAAPVVAAPPAAIARPTPITGEFAPPVPSRSWKYIVIHHSASPAGNAAAFDREHRAKGWDELGYHFVIDNGRGGTDGRVETGPRWLKQKWGAHAKTADNRFNDYGIGVCFVGNFEQGKPTAKQLQSASRLVAWLMETYNIPARNVIGHEDTGKQTLCPGRFLNVTQVRSLAERAIAEAKGAPANFASADDAAALHARVELPESHELLQQTH